MPSTFAWIVVIVEVIGGLLLIVGVLSRIWALGIAIDMAVAAFMVQVPNAETSYGILVKGGVAGELEMLLMASGIALLIVGPGALCIDRILGIEKKEPV